MLLNPTRGLLQVFGHADFLVILTFVSVGPVHLIQFKFRRLEIPPDYNASHLGMYNTRNNWAVYA